MKIKRVHILLAFFIAIAIFGYVTNRDLINWYIEQPIYEFLYTIKAHQSLRHSSQELEKFAKKKESEGMYWEAVSCIKFGEVCPGQDFETVEFLFGKPYKVKTSTDIFGETQEWYYHPPWGFGLYMKVVFRNGSVVKVEKY